jgi:prephenate dehydrogenase
MTDAPVRSLTIVGFGLIGASLAAALKARDPTVHVVAADVAEALSVDAVRDLSDERYDVGLPGALESAMRGTELTVLAAPVRVIEQQLPIALQVATRITDCGSTKRTIARASAAPLFVPGHPMAGRPTGGAAAATSDLFEKKRWLLCPEGRDADVVRFVRSVVEYVGAHVVEMSADDHDRAVAVTSHVPQLFASALAVHARRVHAEVAAGPAFVSATRVAGGNLAMWRDSFSTNADAVSEVITDLAGELERIGRALRAGDVEAVVQVLKNARDLRGRSPDSDP